MPSSTAKDYRAFWLHRGGCTPAEYEDAFAADLARGRFALADGATESCYASLWARLLVDAFVRAPGPPPSRWSAWLPPLQQRWAAEVDGRARTWFARTKAEQGDYAAFLGLVLSQPDGPGRPRWQAVACGDSCLFQVRKGRLCQAFPLTRSEQFGTSPRLVGSQPVADAVLEQKAARAEGDWCDGDRFWLMTDALAQWFLARVEGQGRPWEELAAFWQAEAPERAFSEWVSGLRSRRELRNDDVTLVGVLL